MTVSRETREAGRRARVSRATLVLVATLGLGAILVAACGNPPGPRGWAAPEPVDADSLTLVPHKKTLYAVPKDSPVIAWQFPPKNREQYAVSEAASDELLGLLAVLDLPDSARDDVTELIDGLQVGGDSVGALKSAVSAAATEGSGRDDFNRRVDAIVVTERRALRGVRALYGDLGVSEDGATAYVASFGGWLFALDIETGATRWIVELDNMVGGVLVDGAQIYVGTKDGTVYGLNGGNGSLLFERELDGEIWAAPTRAYDGDGIYVATLEGSLYRLTDTFEVTWRFAGSDGAIAQRPVVDTDRVFVGAFDNKLYAISADTGNEVWNIEGDNWFWGEPVVADDTLFAADLDGKVYALDAQTGDPRWNRPYDAGSPIRSALAVVDDALIIGSRDGYVHRVKLADGTRDGDRLQIGKRLEADLTTDDEGNVYAVTRDPRLWIVDVQGSILSADFSGLTD